MSVASVVCTACWGTGITLTGHACGCRFPYYYVYPQHGGINYDNKTRVFDPQKEIKELKERIKILEDWKNS